MKTALIATFLAIALNITISFGQGYILMENYTEVGGTPVFSGVSYSSDFGPLLVTKYVGANSGINVELLFSLDGGNTYQLAAGSQTPFFALSHDGGTPDTDGAGSFVGPGVAIPGYTSGPVTFLVQPYKDTAFGKIIFAGCAPFTISSLQTNPGNPVGDLLAISGLTPTGLQPFAIRIIPEPTTFALAGLGAAVLTIYRRRTKFPTAL